MFLFVLSLSLALSFLPSFLISPSLSVLMHWTICFSILSFSINVIVQNFRRHLFSCCSESLFFFVVVVMVFLSISLAPVFCGEPLQRLQSIENSPKNCHKIRREMMIFYWWSRSILTLFSVSLVMFLLIYTQYTLWRPFNLFL